MNDRIRDQLEAGEKAFSAAMISNDPDAIRRCITDDWVLVKPERGPLSAETVLDAIRDGILVHGTMTRTTHHLHAMGDVATVTGPGRTPDGTAVARSAPTSGSPTSID